MPQIPDPTQMNRQRLSPSGNIVQFEGRQIGQALEQGGRDLTRLNERVQNYMDHTAEMHARDAAIQLKRAKNQLAVGEKGYARLLNGAATAPGVIEQYRADFTQQAESIGQNLSPLARQKFNAMAKESGMRFEADLMQHIVRQDLSHRGEVYRAQVGVIAETMGLNFNNPDAISRERSSLDATVAQFMAENGIKDPALQERFLQDARGEGHQQVIQGLLNSGNAQAADEYFNANRLEMTADKAKSVENMMKPELANQLGQNFALELSQLYASGASATEVMNRKMQLVQGRSVEVTRAVDNYYKDYVNALEDDRARRSSEILLSAFNGASRSQFQGEMRELYRTDPGLALKVETQLDAIYKRNEKATAGKDKIDSHAQMALYAQLSEAINNPDGPISQEQLVQYAAMLPKAEFKQLLNQRNSALKSAERAKIPPAIINAGMPKSASDSERKNAYKGYVERQLQEWKQQNPGRTPTPEDQRRIVQSASEEYVDVDRYIIANGKVDAYQAEAAQAKGRKVYPSRYRELLPDLKEGDRIRAFEHVQQVRSFLKPGDPPLSDAEILDDWLRNGGVR